MSRRVENMKNKVVTHLRGFAVRELALHLAEQIAFAGPRADVLPLQRLPQVQLGLLETRRAEKREMDEYIGESEMRNFN